MNFIGAYASNSDDSSSDQDTPQADSKKRRLMAPALPTSADAKSNSAANRTSHSGRVRAFAHVEGNYPTTIYIDVPLSDDMQSLLRHAVSQLRCAPLPASSNITEPVSAPDAPASCDCAGTSWQPLLASELHVSLSRTVVLQLTQVDAFVATVRKELGAVSRFVAHFSELAFFANDDRTRSFAALEFAAGSDGLASILRLIRQVDKALKAFSLPQFYQPARPHVSFAWVLNNVLPYLAGNAALAAARAQSAPVAPLAVDEVRVRVGQRVHSIQLR
jgi:hypothetical protein